MAATTFLPQPAVFVLIVVMPLVAAFLYCVSLKVPLSAKRPVAPFSKVNPIYKAQIIISVAIFVACMSCYYNVCMIPSKGCFFGNYTYPIGRLATGVVCVVFGILERIYSDRFNIRIVLPWLAAACAFSIAFVVAGTGLFSASLVLSTALSALLDVSLICYFGILAQNGYLSSPASTGSACFVAHFGFFAGEMLANFLKRTPGMYDSYGDGVGIAFMAVLIAVIIPLTRNEALIWSFINSPAQDFDLGERLRSIAKRYGLTGREIDVLRLITQGYTAKRISEELFISINTTQTHIGHIYAKVGVHKKNELIDLVNMYRKVDG